MNRRLTIPSMIILASASTGIADTNRVHLPENYQSSFVRYTSVDKPAGERPAKMRYFYVNRDALAAATPGQPLPPGTVLIMEDRTIELDDASQPVLDAAGRFVPTDEITNLFVQEKRSGWGADYAEHKRNGEWEYAWFQADGNRKADANLDGCFTCHLGAKETDFNFTFSAFVADIKQ